MSLVQYERESSSKQICIKNCKGASKGNVFPEFILSISVCFFSESQQAKGNPPGDCHMFVVKAQTKAEGEVGFLNWGFGSYKIIV